MQISRIEYEFCANLGNYQNEKVRLVADVEGENYKEDLEELKRMVLTETHSEKEYREMHYKYQEMRIKLQKIKNSFIEALAAYEKMQAFCKFIGMDKEFPDFPKLPDSVIGILTEAKASDNYCEGEIINNDSDDSTGVFGE